MNVKLFALLLAWVVCSTGCVTRQQRLDQEAISDSVNANIAISKLRQNNIPNQYSTYYASAYKKNNNIDGFIAAYNQNLAQKKKLTR